MVDIYLQLAMQGEIKKKERAPPKGEFEIAEDKLLDNYIDTSSLANNLPKNPLIPDSIRYAKIKEDLKNSIKLLNLDLDLNSAFDTLTTEGAAYLEEEQNEEMLLQLSEMSTYLEQVDFTKPLKESLSSLLHISDATMVMILKIGIAKYNEEEYEVSLSIFSLLSSLEHESDEYWYRLGIVAFQLEKLDLALHAFAYAIYLNGEMLGARMFSAKCYVKQGLIDEAKAELVEIKRIIEKTDPEPLWIEMLATFEDNIKKE